MTLSKRAQHKKDGREDRGHAERSGDHFAVGFELDGAPYDPRFHRTLALAALNARETFDRLNTAHGPEVHDRSEDMQSVAVWIEAFDGVNWTVAPGSKWSGIRDVRR